MLDQINETHRVTYRENMDLALQQKQSKLLAATLDLDVSGELASLTDLFEAEMEQEVNTRNGDTLYNGAGHERRWCAMPNPVTYARLVDKVDKVASGIQLEGGYVKVGAATMNRAVDNAIIGGIFGAAQTGQKGTIQVAFDASNVVPVDHGAANPARMSVAKLRAARKILVQNEVDVDSEELYMVLTAEQSDDLLGEVQVTSSDFRSMGGRALEDGRIGQLLGFNFLHIELASAKLRNSGLTVDGSGYRKNPFWAKSGIATCFWERLFTNLTQLATKNYSTQVYARRQVAATRTEEGKVGYILNAE